VVVVLVGREREREKDALLYQNFMLSFQSQLHKASKISFSSQIDFETKEIKFIVLLLYIFVSGRFNLTS
jgi:hypothetical protein